MLVKLTVFSVLVGVAIVADVYLDNNSAGSEIIEASADEEQNNKQEQIFLLDNFVASPVKVTFQRNISCKIRSNSHDKFLSNYHSIRNYQVLKAEETQSSVPLIAIYHRLDFLTHLFPPDDDVYS